MQTQNLFLARVVNLALSEMMASADKPVQQVLGWLINNFSFHLLKDWPSQKHFIPLHHLNNNDQSLIIVMIEKFFRTISSIVLNKF